MEWPAIEIKIRNVPGCALLMHNGQLADPLNDFAKKMKSITGKRTKTDSDLERLADLEWEGGLYLTDDRRVGIPGEVIEGAICRAAKKRKMGGVFQSGFLCQGTFPLEYEGPKDIDSLRQNPRFRDRRNARIGNKTVQRCRPKFDNWALTFTCHYDPEQLNPGTVLEVFKGASIGDYFPRFGRFDIISSTAGTAKRRT